MKRILNGSLPAMIIMIILFLSGCGGKEERHVHGTEADRYTCPMHPQIMEDMPGTCPICKMDLVPVHITANGGIDKSLNSLIKPTDASVLSSVKTVKPQRGERKQNLSLNGIINYNTVNWNSVSARVSGRIERLYVKYNYEAVRKGQKLMDIYSPDLVNAQQELIFLNSNNEPQLLESAKKKLRLLGSTEKQISEVLRTGNVDYSVTIFSPFTGYVAELPGTSSSYSTGAGAMAGGTVISSSNSDGNSMGGMNPGETAVAAVPNVASSSNLLLKEGQYVSAGQKVFNLINSNEVWAEFYANTGQLKNFKRGTPIQVQSADIPGQKANVTVSLVQPYFNEGSNYSLIRATVPNNGNTWKVGQLIRISSDNGDVKGTWLPRTAVLQLGTRYVAFIHENGTFSPVYVQVTSVADNWVEIGNSLNTEQAVAENAWFLVDSESFIKVKQL